jgi:hypothetical protein
VSLNFGCWQEKCSIFLGAIVDDETYLDSAKLCMEWNNKYMVVPPN